MANTPEEKMKLWEELCQRLKRVLVEERGALVVLFFEPGSKGLKSYFYTNSNLSDEQIKELIEINGIQEMAQLAANELSPEPPKKKFDT